jgi:hypothetical protein
MLFAFKLAKAAKGASKVAKGGAKAAKGGAKAAKGGAKAAKAAKGAAKGAKGAKGAAKGAKGAKGLSKGQKVALGVAALAGAGIAAAAISTAVTNNKTYKITRIDQGKDDDLYEISYEGNSTFSDKDKLALSNTDCTPDISGEFTGVAMSAGKMTVRGNQKKKLEKPCTRGDLKVTTTIMNTISSTAKETVKGAVGVVGDVGKGVLDGIGNTLGLGNISSWLSTIFWIAVVIGLLFLGWKGYMMYQASKAAGTNPTSFLTG